MTTANPFDLLVDNENDDVAEIIVTQQKKVAANKPAVVITASPASKLPSKPLPPAQAVRELRNNASNVREGAGRGGLGRGRDERGAGIGQRDFGNVNSSRYGRGADFRGTATPEDGDIGKTSGIDRESSDQTRVSFRGSRRGGLADGNGEGDRPQRRVYERRSGTGRGYEMKRDGAGRGNWGTVADDVHAQGAEENLNVEDKPVDLEKQVKYDGERGDAIKAKGEPAIETAEKEQEDNEMTLEEYEKLREEKRKSLLGMKAEERKVEVDKELQSMQQLSIKKGNDVFIKLGSDKDTSKRNNAEKEERSKKAINIHEFLKPSEGEKYYSPGSRGRGRARGERGSFRGGFLGVDPTSPSAPAILDKGEFPILGAK